MISSTLLQKGVCIVLSSNILPKWSISGSAKSRIHICSAGSLYAVIIPGNLLGHKVYYASILKTGSHEPILSMSIDDPAFSLSFARAWSLHYLSIFSFFSDPAGVCSPSVG